MTVTVVTCWWGHWSHRRCQHPATLQRTDVRTAHPALYCDQHAAEITRLWCAVSTRQPPAFKPVP